MDAEKKKIPDVLSPEVENKYSVKDNTFFREVKDNPKDRINIEIGDSKQADFKPQFKIMRWDNEVNFSIRAEEHDDAIVETEKEKIKYITPEYEVHQYDKPDASEDGGMEFEWVLNKKPSSNILTATIQTKGLDFFYQPALTQEEIDQGTSMPENVVGSYAVYHKTKGGMNDAVGMEYRVGKAFHIYRPKAIDANGAEIWCDLNINTETGILSVTILQEFLDNSAYPVIVDPTFGYTGIGSSIGTIAQQLSDSSQMLGANWDLIEDGNLYSISAALNVSSGTEAVDIFLAIYREDSGGTGSHGLVVGLESLNLSLNTTKTWKTLAANLESLTIDTYILAALGNGVDVVGSSVTADVALDFGASAHNIYSENTTGASSYATRRDENPWTEAASGSNTTRHSIYATYKMHGVIPPKNNLRPRIFAPGHAR